MQPIRSIQYLIIILSLLKALGLIVGVEAPERRESRPAEVALTHQVSTNVRATEMLFSQVKEGLAVSFAKEPFFITSSTVQPPAKAEFPAELAATWFTGVVPLIDFYDPVTGSWRAQNGLGETYTFNTDGTYVYAGFLRLQTGLCLTEVYSYRTGKAKAKADTLTLTPDVVRTRTVINCGTFSDTTTEGPLDEVTLNYEMIEESAGEAHLILTDSTSSTTFDLFAAESLINGDDLCHSGACAG